jgi:hypothetical protein
MGDGDDELSWRGGERRRYPVVAVPAAKRHDARSRARCHGKHARVIAVQDRQPILRQDLDQFPLFLGDGLFDLVLEAELVLGFPSALKSLSLVSRLPLERP